jgi:DNA-binding NarL/FixJ family response regulator
VPYILLGIGIFFVGLAVFLPTKEVQDTEVNLKEQIDVSENLGFFIDELSESVLEAGSELDTRIAELAKLQDSIDSSLEYWKEAIKEAKIAEKQQRLPQKHKDVLALKNKGLNVTEIAKRLDIGKGEVELILSLYGAGDNV